MNFLVASWWWLVIPVLQGSVGHTVYKVGVLMASRLDSPFDLERCGPAVDLALDKVNDRFLAHHGVQLQKVQGSYPSCSGAIAPGLAADMHFKDDVIAFVGPACAFALEPVARLAAYWNTPIITGMGDQPPSEGELAAPASVVSRMHRLRNLRKGIKPTTLFNDKGKYPTLTRMSYCQCRLPHVFTSVFERFGWAHVALLLDKSDLFSLTVGKSLEWGLRKKGILKAVRELDGNERESCETLLRDVSMYARVVILSVRGPLVREFLLAAHSLGMTRGDWAFLDVEIFQGGYWGETGWAAGDDRDAAARAAYEALLRVSLKLPTGDRFDDFADAVKARARLHYNYTFSDGEEVNFFIGAFYDGVYLLGMALNETLTEGADIRDGRNITRRMWGRDFHGITGHVRIDSVGDRDADYAILDLDPVTGKFEVVAFYHGLNGSYKPVAGKAIHWPGGRRGPPPDTPRCGFLGNDPMCQGARIDAELNNMAWRVRPEEVLVEVGTGLGASPALHSINEVLKLSLGWSARGNNATASGLNTPSLNLSSFTVGLYKGNRVAVKKIHRKKLDLNKKLLYEIKLARNVSHENTVRFIGACVDCPLVFVLTEYCPKGSLKDVLANEELQLDWNFRTSLVHDIVQGMCYLHGGLGAHGKLRSSNCLIDGRFVLKISDYGLTTLCTPTDLIKDDTYYYKLLWTAPELLTSSVYPGAAASLKGDVYSFGIILEEIVLRAGPFHHYTPSLSNKEIVSRVCARESPPFRPAVCAGEAGAGAGGGAAAELLDLAARCWTEAPDDRPLENVNVDFLLYLQKYAVATLRLAPAVKIVSRVCARESPPFRPVVCAGEAGAGAGAGGGAAAELLDLAARCWTEAPDDRPLENPITLEMVSTEKIVSRVCARESPPFRPVVCAGEAGAGAGGGAAAELLDLAARCWTEAPDDRPSFDTINATYIKGYCDNLMDDLLSRMEQYANNLESLVEEKTEQLSLEKRRSEELLYQVLPRPVAQQLMAGEMVQPESFECVTVYFSDIVGFTELCAASTPIQVVDLLNDLYSTFDRIIGFYDVYKVETIGDAYMVVSGLPERNGDMHAREICLMALAVVEAVRSFVVRHRPTHRLEVRVGVHSGPVCAGVVGVKMPHYCLFGDTVNTASRMESAGQPLRIHLSESTRALLEQWGTFVVERRGEVELKGRGRMLTHWLLHCSEPEARMVAQGPQPPPQYPILFPSLPQPPMSLQVPYLVVEPPTLAA
ncbi:atrial natriuretic peptide receptor 1-like [Ostrinia nubilalis]|uniref:atrial natriuretic peptide receptor 1-like n=1 Tax=Ostrinia nubilalis TaxID=29057 RepID=UPI0030825C41